MVHTRVNAYMMIKIAIAKDLQIENTQRTQKSWRRRRTGHDPNYPCFNGAASLQRGVTDLNGNCPVDYVASMEPRLCNAV